MTTDRPMPWSEDPGPVVTVHSQDAMGNPIFLGAFPTLDAALAAAAGQTYASIDITDPAVPSGSFLLPDFDSLFIQAPFGWFGELQMGPGLGYLSLGGDADFRIVGNDDDNAVFGSVGNDDIQGGGGNDFLEGFFGNDVLNGGTGIDTLLAMDGDDRVDAGDGADELIGGEGRDTLSGDKGNDLLDGGNGNDRLNGGGGADTLTGGDKRDVLTGGTGQDLLTGGGGADRFVFAPGDSAATSQRDTITDFTPGSDLLDFRALTDTLVYIDADRFGGTAGEVRYAKGIVSVDIDGDRIADLQVALDGAPALTGADFY